MTQTSNPTDGRVAAVQMSSGDNVSVNLAHAADLLGKAAAQGAQLVLLPENFAFMGRGAKGRLAVAEAEGHGPIQTFLAQTARRLGLWIVAGTVPLVLPDDAERVAPACLVYDARGERVARYDKIHLFDVDLPNGGTQYRESVGFRAGPPQPVCVDTPVGRVGLSVCYDLRFPELYRSLSAAGAELLCVPAAFTAPTGEAHWQVLLRARAVENLCYVIAAAQCGTHPDGRATWGHSLIVGPWGQTLASVDSASNEGTAVAPASRAHCRELRARFPALQHRRLPAGGAAYPQRP
ncbi:MAG TPA: carbon-nitrogen hydrolase family protein [Nevskiaceae bacterium]|nr:carbon-nitrogen hydrolase family protein [Nevskiaceae bacterium]